MALSVTQLQTATTVDAALEFVLDVLESEGFPARSWQEGSVNRTFVEYLAQLMAASSQLSNAISAGGFNATSEGLALTLFSSSHYENDRDLGARARYDIQLTVASGSGPFSKGIGTVIVEDPVRLIRYRNVNALTLTDTVPVEDVFEAELVGIAGNDPGVGDISSLISAMAGVTVTNLSATPVLNGADAEGDAELKVRNSAKWSSLSEAGPKATYVRSALDADESVTRVSVDDTNALGAGTVVVYIADATAGLGAPTTTTVLAYIEARKNLTATVTVEAAVGISIIVTYAITYDSTVYANDAAAKTAVELAINTYNSTFPVGGEGPAGAKVYPLGGLYQAANAVVGIVNVTLSVPSVDIPMLTKHVAIILPGDLSGTATAV